MKKELIELFNKIGSEEALRAILKDFYQRMATDLMIGFFFSGRNLDEIMEKQLSFLLRAMDAAPSYSGRPPAQAHWALPPILDGHFDRRLRILEQTLTDHGLDAQSIRVWVNFESAFRNPIVRN